MSKVTKQARFSDAFRNAAVADPSGALAHMFLAAFGIDLGTLVGIAKKMIASNDVDAMIMAVAASVQIRANVAFVGRDYANVRNKYPELIIEGERPNLDIYNFGALHALGHLFCMTTTHAFGRKALAKAGNCITGEGCPDSEAGKINLEISKTWIAEDRALLAQLTASPQPVVNTLFDTIAAKKADFAKKMGPEVGPRPVKTT